MKIKRKWILTGIVLAPGIVAVATFPIFARARENARKSSCQNNMKQISIVMAQYAADFDDRLPPLALQSQGKLIALTSKNRRLPYDKQTALPPFGWCDALLPYSKSTCVLQCPAETSEGNDKAWKKGYTDYWMNANIEKRKLSSLNAVHVVINGDGAGWDGGTGRYAKRGLPGSFSSVIINEFTQPAWPLRHIGGANYAFADGHVKWLTPDQVSSAPGADYTFVP